jgi:hypothetical protein
MQHVALDLAAECLSGIGGSCLPSMVVVALGEPGTPVAPLHSRFYRKKRIIHDLTPLGFLGKNLWSLHSFLTLMERVCRNISTAPTQTKRIKPDMNHLLLIQPRLHCN